MPKTVSTTFVDPTGKVPGEVAVTLVIHPKPRPQPRPKPGYDGGGKTNETDWSDPGLYS